MRFAVGLLWVLVGCAVADAARVRNHYDVDSLVQLSEAIVKGEVGEGTAFKTRDGDCTVYQVKVLKSFKGKLAAEATIRVAGLDEYHYATGIEGRAETTGHVGKGDVVYLFLTPTSTNRGYAMYRLTDAQWTVIESGVRMVAGQHVYAFGQGEVQRRVGNTTMTYFSAELRARTPDENPGLILLTVEQFEQRVAGSQRWLEEIAPVLNGTAAEERIPQYTALLREREQVLKQERGGDDMVAQAIALKLIEVARSELLEGLRRELGGRVRDVVAGGLRYRPAGRDYLLQRLEDVMQPEAVRLEWAELLAGSGWVYYLQMRDEGKPEHAMFATKMARLVAREPASKVSAVLLKAIGECGQDSRFRMPDLLVADLAAAASTLAPPYAGADPQTRFRIAETLLRIHRPTYDQTLPGAGPLLIWVEPKPDLVEGLEHRELRMICRFRNWIPENGPAAQIRLVMRATDTGRETEMPVDSKLAGLRGQGQTFPFKEALPADLPGGRYQVFYRVYQDGKRLGDGIGFECEVPTVQ